MSHIWMGRVSQSHICASVGASLRSGNESCLTYEQRHVLYEGSQFAYGRIMSNGQMSHVSHMSEACFIYDQVAVSVCHTVL